MYIQKIRERKRAHAREGERKEQETSARERKTKGWTGEGKKDKILQRRERGL